jgi:hypothetical protein
VVNPAQTNGVREGSYNRALADDVVELGWAPFSCENHISRQTFPPEKVKPHTTARDSCKQAKIRVFLRIEPAHCGMAKGLQR